METRDSNGKRRKGKGKGKGKEKEKGKNEEKEQLDLLLLLRSPNWQHLSSDLLHLIFDRISSSSIPNLLSFSAVCSSWRSLAKSCPISIPPPPLLLFSSEPNVRRSSMCQLKTLSPNPAPRTYRSPILKKALNRKCCGCSHGHLIFATSSYASVLVADLFSSAQYRLPKPPGEFHPFNHGFLTAPPSSSSCMLILICWGNVLCCRIRPDPQPEDWWVDRRRSGNHVESLVFSNRTLHVLYARNSIFSLEFDPVKHWKQLPDAPPMNDIPYMRLAECDGELLLVCFMRTERYWTNRIELYRVDIDKGVWVRVTSIGDWCLFMDYVGRCPLACPNPGKWGGQSNCVYFAGSHSGCWSVLPLDGTESEHRFELGFTHWPFPAWVYPSMLL